MAYNKDRIEEQAIQTILKEKLTFFADLCIYLEPALSTLYEWELEKSEGIKNALRLNRLKSKKKMRCKWEDSDNPGLQIAAYKLISDLDELKILTMNKVEASGPGGGPIPIEGKHVVEYRNYGDSDTTEG